MFSFFTPTETHPEAKTMADYYDDLAQAVKDVRAEHPDADSDAGFKRAAAVIESLVQLCRNMETVSAFEANDINTGRKELIRTIGSEGLIDVKGEASKLLATKYNKLLRDMLAKKYWPSEDCPAVPFIGKSFLTEYAGSFDARKPHMEAAIKKLDARIASYESTLRMRPAV